MSQARVLTPTEQVQLVASFYNRIKNHPDRAKFVDHIKQNMLKKLDCPAGYKDEMNSKDQGSNICMSFSFQGTCRSTTEFNFKLYENGFNFSLLYHIPAYWGEDYDPEVNFNSSITEKSIKFNPDDLTSLSKITEFLTQSLEDINLFSKSASSSYTAMSTAIPFSAPTENKLTSEEERFLSQCSPETQGYIKNFAEMTRSITACLTTDELKKLDLINKPVKLNGRIYPLSQVISFNYEDPNMPNGQGFFEAVDITPAVTDAVITKIIDSRNPQAEQGAPGGPSFSYSLGLR